MCETWTSNSILITKSSHKSQQNYRHLPHFTKSATIKGSIHRLHRQIQFAAFHSLRLFREPFSQGNSMVTSFLTKPFIFSFGLTVAMTVVGNVHAQQMINTSGPFQTINSSYYEQMGVNWSLQGPNFNASFGGAGGGANAGGVIPPFGGFDPNAGLSTGAAFSNGKTSGSIGLTLNQGSNRTMTSTTPSVTTMNGVPGSINAQTIRPFVVGVVPVVSGAQFAPVMEQERVRQTYLQGQNEYLRQRMQANADAKQSKALEIFNRGQRAESEGNLKMARANYRLALGMSQGLLRVEVMKRLKARGW